MKKLISLSAVLFVAGMVFAQDTIPPPGNKNFPDSMKKDTVPGVNKWKDTTTAGRDNKLPDTTGTATAANTTAAADTTPTTKVADKVVMIDDKVMVVKNGDSTLLADSVTLGSGAVVKNDATVTFKDGSTAKLKNGQYIALTPPPPPAPAESTTSADTTSTATAKPVIEDKVVMTNDQVIIIKNGDSTALEDSIKLKSGAVVQRDGSVRFKDGTTTKLKNGQFIALTPPAEEKKSKKTSTNKKKVKSSS